jgi:hypothetical protein
MKVNVEVKVILAGITGTVGRTDRHRREREKRVGEGKGRVRRGVK